MPNEQFPAVFLDRDGTLIRDVEYCGDPENVEIIDGVSQALRRLKDAGFKLIVITNQSGIGRGYFSVSDYRAVEAEVQRQLADDRCDLFLSTPTRRRLRVPQTKTANDFRRAA